MGSDQSRPKREQRSAEPRTNYGEEVPSEVHYGLTEAREDINHMIRRARQELTTQWTQAQTQNSAIRVQAARPQTHFPVVHSNYNLEQQQTNTRVPAARPQTQSPVVHSNYNLEQQQTNTRVPAARAQTQSPVVHSNYNLEQQQTNTRVPETQLLTQSPVVHSNYELPQQQTIISIERDRTPYSYSRQELHNIAGNTATLYPNLNYAPDASTIASAPAAAAKRNSDQNDFVFVNNNPFEEATAPEQPTANNRRGRGAIPKQRAKCRRDELKDEQYKCPTCKSTFSEDVYQCRNGHSSCATCRASNRRCGCCDSTITDVRNFALQDHLAELGIQTKPAGICQPCPNAKSGCTLRFKTSETEAHLKECPFRQIMCPVTAMAETCSWIGNQAHVRKHFEECHSQHKADVNNEMFLPNILVDNRFLYLVSIGPFNFYVHIKVSSKLQNIQMAVQFLGTKISAFKWSYELHIYNKREPRRKYFYTDTCRPNNESIDDIFRVNDCAILPLSYAMTFVNGGAIAYKFFIKKKDDIDDDNETSKRRQHSRGRARAWHNKNFSK